MMQVSAIRRTPSTARGSRCRLTIARRAVALTGLGWRNSSSTVEPSRITSPSWTGAAVDRLAVDERRLPGAEDVAVAVADQGRVVPREVAHQRDVGVAVGAGAAEDDLVVQADEVTADGVDPEQEAAPRPRLARPGQGPRRVGEVGEAGREPALALVLVSRKTIGAASVSAASAGGSGRGPGPRNAGDGRAPPRAGQAAEGLIAAICCQARLRAWRAAGCSGTTSSTASAAGRISGQRPAARRGIERLDLGRGGLLPRLHVAAGGGQGRLRRARGEPLGAVELVVGAAELAPARLVQRRLPRLGDLAGPPQRRAADLVPGQVLDPLDDPGRLARVEVGADLAGDPVGQAQPGRGQGVGGGPQPLGQVEVVDRAVQVVGRAAPRGPRRPAPGPACRGAGPRGGGRPRRAGWPGRAPRRSGRPARPPPPVARRFANVPAWLTCRPG